MGIWVTSKFFDVSEESNNKAKNPALMRFLVFLYPRTLLFQPSAEYNLELIG